MRRRPKRHGHVGTWPTVEILAGIPAFADRDRQLTADGYRRAENTPVYRTKDGRYTIRVVWRRRTDGSSEVWTKTLRFQFVEIVEVAA